MKFKLAEIYLWLEERNGIVFLIASDGKTTQCLMGFRDGKFYRVKGLQLLGLQYDEEQRIKELQQEELNLIGE